MNAVTHEVFFLFGLIYNSIKHRDSLGETNENQLYPSHFNSIYNRTSFIFRTRKNSHWLNTRHLIPHNVTGPVGVDILLHTVAQEARLMEVPP